MKREELLIEADELAGMLDDPNLRLFDATVNFASDAREEYNKGHIPGAAFLSHDDISDPDSSLQLTLPGEQLLGELLGKQGIGNDNLVVAYSTGEMCWATRIWWVLQYAGHRNVRVLNGGFGAWQAQGRETEQQANSYAETTFNTSLTPSMFASYEEVQAALGDGASCVVNALPEGLYTGEMESPYSGHISGSVNHPMHGFMENQHILPDETLKSLMADKLSGERLITYCGGGIAATLNACVAKLAGVEDVAVYDGSMREWMSLELPVTQGTDPG